MKRNFSIIVALYFLSAAFLLAQEPSGAQPASDKAAELVKQGMKLNSEGKQDEALALYNQAMRMSPDSYQPHLAAGMALDLKGDYQQARQHLSKAVELAPADAKERALRTMAVSYTFECNLAEAGNYEQQAFDGRMAKQDFTGAAEVANELARIDLECGDNDNAYKWYKTGYDTALRKPAINDAEKNLWLWRWENAQARIAARRGQRPEAQQHLTAAKAALDKANNPDQLRFYPYLSGYVALYSGDYKSAIADLQKADQRDPFVLSLLAQAYEKADDHAQAMEYYRKVLSSNAHNPTNAFARPLAKKKVGAGAA